MYSNNSSLNQIIPLDLNPINTKILSNVHQVQEIKRELKELEHWDLAKNFYHGVRCGDVPLVQAALSFSPNLLNELDTQLMGALHYAVRYNQTKVMRLLLSLGANVNIRGKQGIRPLHIAAAENNEEALTILLQTRRIKIDCPDEKGQTALHIATKGSHANVTHILLEHRANIMQTENDGVTVLHRPARKDDKFVCDILINKPELIWTPDNNGLNPLMAASSEGGVEVLQTFIDIMKKSKSNVKSIINMKDSDGTTSLHFASQYGHYEVMQVLIENGAEVNSIRNDKHTPLHGAALMGKENCVNLLLENGANVYAADNRRRTSLHKAVITNQCKIAEILLNKNANPNCQDDDFKTPLHWACRKGSEEMVKLLLGYHPTLKTSDINMNTCLHWAVIGECVPVIKLILEEASSTKNCEELINMSDISNKSPLHIAVENKQDEIVTLLIQNGASVTSVEFNDRNPAQIASKLGNLACLRNLMTSVEHRKEALVHRDVDEYTSLLLAAENGELSVFKYLCDMGANFNAKDELGRTALMLSVSNGHFGIAKNLLEKDVDLNACDKNKNTALHYACKGDREGKCIKMLLENGANLSENFSKKTPVDIALLIRNNVAIDILFDEDHHEWTMSFRRSDGRTVLDALIRYSPDTVNTLLDRCIIAASEDPLDKNFSVLYNFQYIDPGIDDPASSPNRYMALKTMAEERQESLLNHPICKTILDHKWTRGVRLLYWLDFLFYLVFLACMTSFVSTQDPPKHTEIDVTTGCRNQSIGGKYSTARVTLTDPGILVQKIIITTFLCIQCLNHLFKIIYTRTEYFKNVENYFFLILYGITWVFVYPTNSEPCLYNWVAGMIAIVLAWALIIFEIEHLPITGIYALMFQKVLVSLVKVIVVFLFFIVGFAIAFYIGMKNETPFKSIPYSILKTFDMTVGELEFVTYFIDSKHGDFQEALDAIFICFVIMMNIALMNLLVGVAVGDIDGIRQDATLSLLTIRITLIYNIETNLPAYFQRKLHMKYMEIYPNQDVGMCSTFVFGDYGKIYKNWLAKDHIEESTDTKLTEIENSMMETKATIQQIANKLKI